MNQTIALRIIIKLLIVITKMIGRNAICADVVAEAEAFLDREPTA